MSVSSGPIEPNSDSSATRSTPERPAVRTHIIRRALGWIRPSFQNITKGARTVLLWGTVVALVYNSALTYWPRKTSAIFVVLPNITQYAHSNASTQDGTRTVPEDLWDGIAEGATIVNQEWRLVFDKGNPRAYATIVPVDDGPDAQDTCTRIADYRKQYDCVLLLAHESSTLARRVWLDYYRTAKLPVVLLGPTNPVLTQDDHLSETSVMLRLLPNDDKQVEVLRDIASGKYSSSKQQGAVPTRHLFLLADRGNPVYSEYISRALIQPLPDNIEFCGSVEVSATNSTLVDISVIYRSRPDVLAFVGMDVAAQAFVQSLEREWSLLLSNESKALGESAAPLLDWFSKVELVFTDGCASGGFHEFVISSKRLPWKAVYVVSCAPPEDGLESGSSQAELAAFDFKPIGKAAIMLANRLSLATWRREGSLSAAGILRQLEQCRSSQAFFAADETYPATGDGALPKRLARFQFDIQGDNIRWRWQVYRKEREEKVFRHVGESD